MRVPRPSPPAALAAVVFAGYVAVSRAVLHLHPFSIFDMYAHAHAPSGSRLALRDESGALREIREGEAFACERPVEPASCGGPDVYSPGYVDRAAARWIADRAGPAPGGRPIDVVRRVWRFPPGAGPPEIRDCLVARCRVVLR